MNIATCLGEKYMASSDNMKQQQAMTGETQQVVQAFDALDTDAKLAWF